MRVGALPEVLDGGEAGLLIEPGDWEALAQSINRILDDPPFAGRLGEVAGKRAPRLWDVKRIASRIDVVYREVLSLERA
jgi:glycosyltransferase involved in cell wall biosynthesis